MKILHVSSGYYPQIGGVERHVQAISEALARHGHEVAVATSTRDLGLARREEIAGVTIHRFHTLGRYPYLYPVGLFRYLREEASSFDIVHAHNYHTLVPILAALACRRIVMSPYYHVRSSNRLTNALHDIYDPLAMAMLRGASSIICLSYGEADLVARRFGVGRSNIVVIPSISSSAVQTCDIVVGQRSCVSGSSRLILSIGRLESYKCVDRLIAAVPYLPGNFELVIIGDGPERANLELMAARFGVQQRVSFLGYVDDNDLRIWYERADVVASLSMAESFGRIVVEALSSGRRVFCSDIPAFREFADEFPNAVAIAFDTADAQALAAEIQASVCRPATRISLERYRSATILASTEQVYGLICAGAARLDKPTLTQEAIVHENSARI